MDFLLTTNGLFHSLKILLFYHYFEIFSLSFTWQILKCYLLRLKLICQRFTLASPHLETTFITTSINTSSRGWSNITNILFFPACSLISFKLTQIAYLTKLDRTISTCTYKIFTPTLPTSYSQVMSLQFFNWRRNRKLRFEINLSQQFLRLSISLDKFVMSCCQDFT